MFSAHTEVLVYTDTGDLKIMSKVHLNNVSVQITNEVSKKILSLCYFIIWSFYNMAYTVLRSKFWLICLRPHLVCGMYVGLPHLDQGFDCPAVPTPTGFMEGCLTVLM